ncbi:hypothetical protein ACQB60_34980 [Actinomycetota bacterium Odt1-20B]
MNDFDSDAALDALLDALLDTADDAVLATVEQNLHLEDGHAALLAQSGSPEQGSQPPHQDWRPELHFAAPAVTVRLVNVGGNDYAVYVDSGDNRLVNDVLSKLDRVAKYLREHRSCNQTAPVLPELASLKSGLSERRMSEQEALSALAHIVDHLAQLQGGLSIEHAAFLDVVLALLEQARPLVVRLFDNADDNSAAPTSTW